MIKDRRRGARNWARGAFAFFWILLAGVSGVYLFTLLTNPSALGNQVLRVNSGEAPPGSEQASSSLDSDEVSEIKSSLRELSRQMAEINTRQKAIEKAVGPVASLSSEESATTSTPPPEPVTPPAPAIAAAPEAVKPKPAEARKPAEAPKPAQTTALEPKPVEKSAAEVKPAAPSASSAPAPEASSDEDNNEAEPTPPPVTVSEPDEPIPEESSTPTLSSNLSAPTPPKPETAPKTQSASTPKTENASPAAPMGTGEAKPSGPAEIAALDPTALPPAANDGSTRYGIEIGVVAKQDGLRPLWREFLTNHAALVAGLQPRRVLAPDKKWRLVAGPFSNAAEATQACALFKKAQKPCEPTVYAGDSL
jgi:SPOR domain